MRAQLTALILVCTLILPSPLVCGTIDHSVTVGIGEEYNSNVNEESDGDPDWVTKATLNGRISYEGPRVYASILADGSFNLYALGKRDPEFKGRGLAELKIEAVQDLLFIEGEDKISQVYSNIVRGESNENDSNRDQVFQNETKLRVYLTPRLSDRMTLKGGYEFQAWLYDNNEPKQDYGFGVNKWQHRLFAGASYELTPTITLTLDAEGSRQEPRDSAFNRGTVYAGFRWEYAQDCSLYAKAGPRATFYDNGSVTANPYWDAKLLHTFGRLFLTAETSSRYEDNPSRDYDALRNSAGASLGYTFDRGTLEARGRYSFLTGEDTEDSNQLTLGLSGTYELTDRLLLKAGVSREFSHTTNRDYSRWYANASLRYDLDQGFSVEGYYRWKFSDSDQGARDNYTVNMVGIQLRKTF